MKYTQTYQPQLSLQIISTLTELSSYSPSRSRG